MTIIIEYDIDNSNNVMTCRHGNKFDDDKGNDMATVNVRLLSQQ